MLRRDVPVPVSALARVNRLLWDPAGPLVLRPADGERFAAWLRQIEVDMGARPRGPAPPPRYRYHPGVPSSDPKLDLIASVPLFAGLDKREVGFLGRLMDDVDVSDGKVLTR